MGSYRLSREEILDAVTVTGQSRSQLNLSMLAIKSLEVETRVREEIKQFPGENANGLLSALTSDVMFFLQNPTGTIPHK